MQPVHLEHYQQRSSRSFFIFKMQENRLLDKFILWKIIKITIYHQMSYFTTKMHQIINSTSAEAAPDPADWDGWPYGGSTPRAGNLSQSNQPPRSTQPGHPFVEGCNEYRSKGGDALRLGVKEDMMLFAGNTVWSISERVRGVCA